MNTLTPQQLQFIDHYLENSGVEYVDIRTEMTDHVATALETQEGDFYENFRLYMLDHKQELLKNYKYFKRLATRGAFKVVGKTLLKPWFLVLPFVVVYICFNLAKTIGVSQVSEYLEFTYFGLFFLSVLPYLVGLLVLKKKFSVASKVVNAPGLVLYFAHEAVRPLRLNDNAWVSFVFFALMITFAAAIAVTSFIQRRKYRLQYR
jgi:hypothetical protein